MKKILALLCAVICALALLGCTQKIELSEYVIVIPENADISTKYASENLALLLEQKTGVAITVVTDAEPEREREILLGETSREFSKTEKSLSEREYTVFARDEKIILKGSGIYIGAACSDFVSKYITAPEQNEIPTDEQVFTYKTPDTYKSVIFMIGDGMGENHIKMAEKCGMESFIARQFTATGTSITRSQSVIDGAASATDSAASATAMSTGYKTINDYVGVDKDGQRLKNVRELAREMKAMTAVITTDVITGGTPSAYLCHNVSREDTEGLQAEIDGIVQRGEIDYIAADVSDNLTSSVKEALDKLCLSENGFFMMIEEGLIDKASHNKEEELAVDYVKRFNDAVAYATQFALCHPDVALIVTADHETGNLRQINGAPCGYYFTSYAHTNLDTPIFALGAGSELFNGTRVENIALAKYCAKAFSQEEFGGYIEE